MILISLIWSLMDEIQKKENNYTLELSVKSPSLHPIFGPAFKPLSPLSVVSAK
jgi:hypothetical protein